MQLFEIDLSHCKLGNTGAHAIGAYLDQNRRLKILRLGDNKIGPDGAAGIVFGLLQERSAPLKILDLRLNPLMDAGGSHICAREFRRFGRPS